MSDPPPLGNITNIPKATKATPTATPGTSKQENIHPSVEKSSVSGHSDNEEAEIVASLKAKKHVSLPFRLVDDFGRFGTDDENGGKLLQYLHKAFPTVTEINITAPFLIVVCTQIPSDPLPFTVGGQSTIFTTEKKPSDEWFDLGTPAKKRKSIVTSLNFHSKDKVTDEAIQTIADELQQVNLRPTEIGYMGGFLRLVFPHSVDPTDIPYRIAGCTVFIQSQSATTAARRMKIPAGTDTDTNDYLAHPDRTLRPGVMLSSSFHGNGAQYLSTTSGLLVKDAQGNHYVTCALHGFNPDGIVFHPDPVKGKPIGKVVRTFPNVDVGLVHLESGIRYTNEFFESDEGGASGLIPSGFAQKTIPGENLEMDNPYNGSCAAAVIGTNHILEGVRYHEHKWIILERGTRLRDRCCGSPIVDENGLVAAIFRYALGERADIGYAVPALEVEKLGLKLVDSHEF